MTVIVKDQIVDVMNNDIISHVSDAFGVTFANVSDMVKGVPLSDIAGYDFDEYFARNLFKKLEDDLGLDPDRVATENALLHIKRTIEWDIKFRATVSKAPPNLMKVLSKARDILHKMFEDFTVFSVFPRFTLGATEHLTRGEDVLTRIRDSSGYTTLRSKFNDVEFGWLMSNLPHVESQKSNDYTLFETVLKTAKESRPIGYHEVLTLAVQAGVGDYTQEKLLSVGIDIRVAQEIHKAYAYYYSVFDDYCTMDQSNASQNILRAHCRYLLPSKFFQFIDKICPSSIKIDEKLYHHEMMAAQGNGLIFPLQTAIFWALISACAYVKGVKGDVLQYGDDSIFKSELFGLVDQVFTSIGMEVNREKSFFSDHIRESCGGDFFNGINVRPYYVKRMPKTTTDWYHICNGIFRVGCANNNFVWRSSAFKRFWLRCLSSIPQSERLFGPVEYGDVVLHSNNTNKYCFNLKGTKIRVLGTVYSEDGKGFGVISQGLPGNVLLKATTLSFLARGGYVLYSDAQKLKLKTTESGYYPKNFGVRRTKVVPKWQHYPLGPIQNHDDIDHVFDRLKLDSEFMLYKYNIKLDYYRGVLIKLLKNILYKRRTVESEVFDVDLDI